MQLYSNSIGRILSVRSALLSRSERSVMGMTERPDVGFLASATSPSEIFNRSLSLRNSFTVAFRHDRPKVYLAQEDMV